MSAKKQTTKQTNTENSNKKRLHSDCPKYTNEIGERVCELTATTTFGIRKISEIISEEMGVYIPGTTMWKWLRDDKNNIWERYARAKQLQAELIAEELIEISDDSSDDVMLNEKGQKIENKEFVNRSRLRIDTRKWLLEKLLPNKYGNNLKIEDDKPQTIVVNINKSNE